MSAECRFELTPETVASYYEDHDDEDWWDNYETFDPLYETLAAEGWQCPHDRVPGYRLCAFHMAPEQRREADRSVETDLSDEGVRERVVEKLRDDDGDGRDSKQFVGATFGRLDLQHQAIDSRADSYPVAYHFATVGAGTDEEPAFDLANATVSHQLLAPFVDVEGTLRLKNASVEKDCLFAGATVDALNSLDATFEEASFRELTADVVNCKWTEFGGYTDFTGAAIEFGGVFEDIDAAEITFENARMRCGVFREAVVKSELVFDDAVVGDLDLRESRCGRLDFRAVTRLEGFDRLLDFRAADVDAGEIAFAGDGDVRTDESGTTTGGDDEEARIDASGATFGTVDVAVDGEKTLEPVYVSNTTFDGFDFSAYHESLEPDWSLDSPSDPIQDAYRSEVVPDGRAGDRERELTYVKAKNGANRVDDHRSASEFFVQETRHRQEHLFDVFWSGGTQFDTRAGFEWFTLAVLFRLSRYGERPRKTLEWSLGVVVAAAAAYPFVGTPVGGTTLSWFSGDLLSVGVRSLSFSAATFTSLGVGGLPGTPAANVLAASEALAGTFLVALFVFSLGRQVSR